VTVCINDHKCYFGEIAKTQNPILQPEIKLSETGKIAQQCWLEIPKHFSNIELDEFIIMPSHLHGIIAIINGDSIVGNGHAYSLHKKPQYQKLPVIIGSFKSAVTKQINQTYAANSFSWQKSYYDHIIRNEKSLQKIREYIRNNPAKWEEDIENEEFLQKLSKEEQEKKVKEYYSRLYL